MQAEAMAKPADIVADGTGLLDDLPHGPPDVVRSRARHRRGNARFGREPQRVMGARRVGGDGADRIIAIEIAEIAVEGRARIDEEDVPRLDNPVMRTAHDLRNAARS